MELYDPHTACSLFLALSNAAPNVCADKVIGDHFLLPTPAGITSADYYVSEGDYLYQRHLSKPEANQIPLRKLPRAYYVRESISEELSGGAAKCVHRSRTELSLHRRLYQSSWFS